MLSKQKDNSFKNLNINDIFNIENGNIAYKSKNFTYPINFYILNKEITSNILKFLNKILEESKIKELNLSIGFKEGK